MKALNHNLIIEQSCSIT